MRQLFNCVIVASSLVFHLGQPARAEPTSSEDPALKRKFAALGMIYQDWQAQEPGTDRRKELINEFLDKSKDYLAVTQEGDKTAGQVWTFRAIAACEIGSEEDARAAGAHMLALGMDKSEATLVTKALAFLERKGWLVNPKEAAAITKAEAERAAAERERARFEATPEGRKMKLRSVLQGPVDPAKISVLRKAADELKSLAPDDPAPAEFAAATDLQTLADSAAKEVPPLHLKPDDEAFRLGELYILPARVDNLPKARRQLDQFNYGPKIDENNRSFFKRKIVEILTAKGRTEDAITLLSEINDLWHRREAGVYLGKFVGMKGNRAASERAFTIALDAQESGVSADKAANTPVNRASHWGEFARDQALAGFQDEARSNFRKAEQFAKKGSSKDESDVWMWGRLGGNYSAAGWLSEAEDALRNMTSGSRLTPLRLNSFWGNAVNLRQQVGDEEGANRLFAAYRDALDAAETKFAALKKAPRLERPWSGRTVWLAKHGRATEARELFSANSGKLRFNNDAFEAIMSGLLNEGKIDAATEFLANTPLGFGTADDETETADSVAYAKGQIAAATLRHRGYVSAQKYVTALSNGLSRYFAFLHTARLLTPIPELE